MSQLKITYTDGTELSWDGGNEQIIDNENAIYEILETNNISLSDLPYQSPFGYLIEIN